VGATYTGPVTLERYQEVMVALSESVIKKCVSAPWRRNDHDAISRLAIKPRYLGKPCIADKKVTMERNQEVMVALSVSVMKNRLKRPLAEKSR